VAAGLTLYTIGHGTSPIDDFIAYLQSAGIESLVDIRRFPGSRHNPQYGSEALAASLNGADIAYRNAIDLGGRRRAHVDSPNIALRNEAFRAYADYMMTSEFHDALRELLADAAKRPTAIMCSETVWWRCHRRLVSDAVILLAEHDVRHIVAGKVSPHRLTDGVRKAGDDLVYDEGV
jgi:uncharacterized protein (DUF488 family)